MLPPPQPPRRNRSINSYEGALLVKASGRVFRPSVAPRKGRWGFAGRGEVAPAAADGWDGRAVKAGRRPFPYIARAQKLGGTVQVPLVDNGAIEFAYLADPLGNRFGVWQRKAGE